MRNTSRLFAAHIQPDLHAERLLVAQITMHEFLVYQDHARRCGAIDRSKGTAAQHRDASGPKIVRGNDKIEGVGPLAGW
jgi:hypothetical protein